MDRIQPESLHVVAQLSTEWDNPEIVSRIVDSDNLTDLLEIDGIEENVAMTILAVSEAINRQEQCSEPVELVFAGRSKYTNFAIAKKVFKFLRVNEVTNYCEEFNTVYSNAIQTIVLRNETDDPYYDILALWMYYENRASKELNSIERDSQPGSVKRFDLWERVLTTQFLIISKDSSRIRTSLAANKIIPPPMQTEVEGISSTDRHINSDLKGIYEAFYNKAIERKRHQSIISKSIDFFRETILSIPIPAFTPADYLYIFRDVIGKNRNAK